MPPHITMLRAMTIAQAARTEIHHAYRHYVTHKSGTFPAMPSPSLLSSPLLSSPLLYAPTSCVSLNDCMSTKLTCEHACAHVFIRTSLCAICDVIHR